MAALVGGAKGVCGRVCRLSPTLAEALYLSRGTRRHAATSMCAPLSADCSQMHASLLRLTSSEGELCMVWRRGWCVGQLLCFYRCAHGCAPASGEAVVLQRRPNARSFYPTHQLQS